MQQTILFRVIKESAAGVIHRGRNQDSLYAARKETPIEPGERGFIHLQITTKNAPHSTTVEHYALVPFNLDDNLQLGELLKLAGGKNDGE
jgi:hypothetical protein